MDWGRVPRGNALRLEEAATEARREWTVATGGARGGGAGERQDAHRARGGNGAGRDGRAGRDDGAGRKARRGTASRDRAVAVGRTVGEGRARRHDGLGGAFGLATLRLLALFVAVAAAILITIVSTGAALSMARDRRNTAILIKLVLSYTIFGDTYSCHGLCHVDCGLAASTRAIGPLGSDSVGWGVHDRQRFSCSRLEDGGLLGLLVMAIGSRGVVLGLAWSLGLEHGQWMYLTGPFSIDHLLP